MRLQSKMAEIDHFQQLVTQVSLTPDTHEHISSGTLPLASQAKLSLQKSRECARHGNVDE